MIAAIVVPYWWGRAIAVNDTQWLLDNLSALEPRGAAFVAWTVTLIAVSGLGLLVVDAHRRLWGAVFVIGLAAEQLIAGLCILKIDFLVCDICGVRRVVGIGECGESWHYSSWYWRCRFRGAVGGIVGDD